MRDNIKIPWSEQLIWVVVFILVLVLIQRVHKETHSHQTLQDKDYVQAIVGEAANQTEETMICVAHALHNRGNLTGVYGYSAKHVWSENDNTWRKAWDAWDISGKDSVDPVHGAKNFGTIDDEGIESDMIQCGDFYFY